MKGIILAGNSGNRLHPLTLGVPKQLLPIYDRPMIFYPIETLIEVGVTDILIITDPLHTAAFVKTLGDGSKFGASFSYTIQQNPEGAAQALKSAEDFLKNESVCFITGDCIILGEKRGSKLNKAIRAAEKSGQSTIFICKDDDPNQYGVVNLDTRGRCEKVEGKPTDSNYYSITGLYVFPKGVTNYAKVVEKSERGRLEIVSINQAYFNANKLQVQILGNDLRWFDTNTFDNILTISKYVQHHENYDSINRTNNNTKTTT